VPASWLRRRWDAAVVAAIIVYFAARCLFLAIKLPHRIPPDEVAHLGRSELFAKAAFLPEPSPDALSLGLLETSPYLYYLVAGDLLGVAPPGLSNLLCLRLLSVAFGVATVCIGWRWIRLFSRNRVVHVTFLAMLTNTLMFTAVCSSVTYDSMVNMLAAGSILYFTRILKRPSANAYLGFSLCVAAGTLTKSSFLPLAFILALGIGVSRRRDFRVAPAALRGAFVPFRVQRAAACLVLLLLVTLNALHYGRNLVRHGALDPSPATILSIDEQMRYPSYAVPAILSLYLSGEVGFAQARRLAEGLPLMTARRDAINVLRVAREQRSAGIAFEPVSRWDYALRWSRLMAQRTFGYMGHENALKVGWWLVPYFIVFLGAALSYGAALARPGNDPVHAWLAVATLFYGWVLMEYVSYSAYREWQNVPVMLQGRYIFPVILPLFGLAAHHLVDPWPKRMQVGLAVTVSALFIAGDLPSLLWGADHATFFPENATAVAP
jgi:hypothetical protein